MIRAAVIEMRVPTAFLLINSDETGGNQIIFGDDHNACFTDTYVTDLTSYLEFIFGYRGVGETRREEFIEYGGRNGPPKTFTAEDLPDGPKDLDSLMELLEALYEALWSISSTISRS